jgi:methylenetetrahydrofolate dehydrogenase (NADP+)/methenyltetrahydrofolate cyclohydrolase
VGARIIDGKAIAQQVREDVARRVKAAGVTPGFCDVLVGDDPASAKYVSMKLKAVESIGGKAFDRTLPADVPLDALLGVIGELNANPEVHGVIVQLPIPDHLDPNVVIDAIDPAKDVDGLHPRNIGLLVTGRTRFAPATPAGVVELLRRSGVETKGAHVVIVGRSNLVGRPLSVLLSQRDTNATVTLCHTGTTDLAAHTRRADILISAAGHVGAITADMVKPGAVVIDVGTNPGPDGKLVGDVAFDEVAEVASAITPVPGGVGPMTVAMLLANTAKAAGA